MEFLLFSLFFLVALIFFIAGKDDFGRTENKLIIKEKIKEEENTKPALEEEKVKEEENTKPALGEETSKI